MPTTENRELYDRAEKVIFELSELNVDCGYFEGEIAKIAAWNDLGTWTKAGRSGGQMGLAPSRPFMRNAAAYMQDKVPALFDKFVERAIQKGDMDAIGINIAIGYAVSARIKKEITDFTTPANAASTIKRKNSSHPLTDKGTMRRSTSFEVRRGDAPVSVRYKAKG